MPPHVPDGGVLLPRDGRPRPPAPLADREAALALERLRGVGPARWTAALVEAAWDAAAALGRHPAPAAAKREAYDAAQRALHGAERIGASLHLLGDAAYPVALHDLPDPPPVLWSLGSMSRLDAAPRVAVVGTRTASAYGLRAARALCDAIAGAGACIVSGMAAGIDGMAHERALAAGAATVAVLGSGPDVSFPAHHRPLHRRIAADGLVLAEHPPGTRPTAGGFPRRNRIVAALADLVIVVEAGVRSGAMITAGLAADLGRPVAAVPGPVDAVRSAGTNALLRDGAHVLATPDDALTLLGLARAASGTEPAGASRIGSALLGEDRAVWLALEEPAPDLDVLAARLALPAARAAAALTRLELACRAEVDHVGTIRRLAG
ncbi:MAG TPA: DNA-processing protein DprA [Gemmatirosa sp.]|nr:DNA-processing protein DprA [Gemmatirosa sp.]